MERHELKSVIIERVDKLERRALVLKTTGFGAVLAGSLALVVFGLEAVITESARSGFFAFASLSFSDFSAIASNFSDYLFSIIESFPVFSTAVLFAGIFFAVWSAARFVNEIAIMRKKKLFAFS